MPKAIRRESLVRGKSAGAEKEISFIGVAAHQLRTPLTSIRWFLEMLMGGDVGPLTNSQKDVVEQVSKNTERMIALVSLLLQISRAESGRLKIEPVALDLKSITREVILSMKPILEAKSQKVEISTNPDPLLTVLVDYDIIWQVIQNLISNASRYSSDSAGIFVSITTKETEIEYSVKDSGIGIPKAEQERVFEKFFRTTNALRFVPEGSGLGLSLNKYLVENWGGKIWFNSVEGKGTTFFFTIPIEGTKPKEGEVRLRV